MKAKGGFILYHISHRYLYEKLLEKDRVIEKIIEQKKLKAGITINSEIQIDRLKKRTLDNLKVILDKWEKIEV